MEALWLSLEIASLATVLVIAVGLPLALFLVRLPALPSRLLESVLLAPLVVPPSVTGLALLWLLGGHGAVGALTSALGLGTLLFTRAAAVLAAAVVSFPFFLRGARVALAEVSPAYLSLAQTLGDSPGRAFWRVHLPLARRGLLGGAALAFGRALGEFGATLMVAGAISGRTETLALAVYEHALAPGEMPQAWAAAGLLLGAGVIVLALMGMAEPPR